MILVVAGWSTIYLTRSAYTVEGTIGWMPDKTYPWNIGGRFDLVLETEKRQWLRFPSLHGVCVNQAPRGAACEKPEFPVGAHIRLTVTSFVDPLFCPDLGVFLADPSCLGRYTRRYVSIDAIEVAGRQVTVGWSPNRSISALYIAILVLSGLLAAHRWRLSAIRTRTLLLYIMIVFGFAFWPIAAFF